MSGEKRDVFNRRMVVQTSFGSESAILGNVRY